MIKQYHYHFGDFVGKKPKREDYDGSEDDDGSVKEQMKLFRQAEKHAAERKGSQDNGERTGDGGKTKGKGRPTRGALDDHVFKY